MSRQRAPERFGEGDETDAAKALKCSLEEFHRFLPRLLRRGFPLPDETTGRYDLDAIDQWRRRRHPALFHNALASNAGSDDAFVVRPRIGAVS